MSPIPLSPRPLNPDPRAQTDDTAFCSNHPGERPQVLAQLAKDISDLISGARHASMDRRSGPQEWSSPRGEPTSATALARPPSCETMRSPATELRASNLLATGTGHTTVESRTEPWMAGMCASTKHPSLQREEATTLQIRTRSPHAPLPGVHAILSNIESREAALHQKVQQLMEEKAKQQQQWEHEVARLQRSNARMEEELRRRQSVDALKVQADSFDARLGNQRLHREPHFHRGQPHTHREVVLGCETLSEGTRSGARTPVETRVESQILPQDIRDELQFQLSEIRAEVTRCVQALCTPEALPAAEVSDIRQQLSALSNEVAQTSRALLDGHGTDGYVGGGREAEFSEIRQQLEALQVQVSSAMRAAGASPVLPEAKDAPQLPPSPRGIELSELRAEVSSLRSEIAEANRLNQGPRPVDASDIRAQIEARRWNTGQPSSAATRPVALQSSNDISAALQGRLAALRSEVGRVIQDPRHMEGEASCSLEAQLGALLSELQAARSSASATCVTAKNRCGVQTPHWQRHDLGLRHDQLLAHQSDSQCRMTTGALDAFGLQQEQLQPLRQQQQQQQQQPVQPVQPLQQACRSTEIGADQCRFVDVPLGQQNWDLHATRPCSEFVAAVPAAPPIHGIQTPPLFLCPHLAADLAGTCGTSALHRSLSGSRSGSGRNSPQLPMTPLLGGYAGPNMPARHAVVDHPREREPAVASFSKTPMHAANGSALDSFNTAPSAGLGSTYSPRCCPGGDDVSRPMVPASDASSSRPVEAKLNFMPAELGGPPTEPLDRAPQCAMLRPMRTKIPRQEAASSWRGMG